MGIQFPGTKPARHACGFEEGSYDFVWREATLVLPFWEGTGIPRDLSAFNHEVIFYNTANPPVWSQSSAGIGMFFTNPTNGEVQQQALRVVGYGDKVGAMAEGTWVVDFETFFLQGGPNQRGILEYGGSDPGAHLTYGVGNDGTFQFNSPFGIVEYNAPFGLNSLQRLVLVHTASSKTGNLHTDLFMNGNQVADPGTNLVIGDWPNFGDLFVGGSDITGKEENAFYGVINQVIVSQYSWTRAEALQFLTNPFGYLEAAPGLVGPGTVGCWDGRPSLGPALSGDISLEAALTGAPSLAAALSGEPSLGRGFSGDASLAPALSGDALLCGKED